MGYLQKMRLFFGFCFGFTVEIFFFFVLQKKDGKDFPSKSAQIVFIPAWLQGWDPGNLCVLSQTPNLTRKGFSSGFFRVVFGKGVDFLGIPKGAGISWSPGETFFGSFPAKSLLLSPIPSSFLKYLWHLFPALHMGRYCWSLNIEVGISQFSHSWGIFVWRFQCSITPCKIFLIFLALPGFAVGIWEIPNFAGWFFSTLRKKKIKSPKRENREFKQSLVLGWELGSGFECSHQDK